MAAVVLRHHPPGRGRSASEYINAIDEVRLTEHFVGLAKCL